MKEIDMETWDRKEHFAFFSNSDLPFYNVNFNVDITGLREYAQKAGISFNNALIYLTVKTLNRIRNFLYRILDGKVVEYERLHPSFACLRNGEELFRFITVDYNENIAVFDKTVKEAINNSCQYFELGRMKGRSDFVFISALPWIPFTGIDHTMNLSKDDAVPRVSWGKFYQSGEKVLIPFNVRVNHMFVDGIHVGQFFQHLHEEIRTLVKTVPKS
jgi:chloramphenicol O-acetyltransferase type A